MLILKNLQFIFTLIGLISIPIFLTDFLIGKCFPKSIVTRITFKYIVKNVITIKSIEEIKVIKNSEYKNVRYIRIQNCIKFSKNESPFFYFLIYEEDGKIIFAIKQYVSFYLILIGFYLSVVFRELQSFQLINNLIAITGGLITLCMILIPNINSLHHAIKEKSNDIKNLTNAST